MRDIKKAVVLILALLGVYMLVFHSSPFSFSHEAIGLGYNHMIHRIIGVVLLVAAGLVAWKWK